MAKLVDTISIKAIRTNILLPIPEEVLQLTETHTCE